MNEKEMIEEMAKDIEDNFINKCLCGQWYEDDYKELAEELIRLNYRKIPEGSVVLDRQEHQKYSAYKIIEPEIKGCLDRERKLEKQIAELEEQRDRQAYIAEDLIQEKHRWTEQARKITATECYAIVNKKCDPEFNICDGRLYHVGYQAALRDIKKCLEERFGEEIKK